jgi:sensor histidine kinase regulating citrate/malate metabolism
MFSLIITIISIALVAAIAVATLYYGGTQFSQGTAKATADQIISAAQQIAAPCMRTTLVAARTTSRGRSAVSAT